MPTIFRLSKKDLEIILKHLRPDLSESQIEKCSQEKLKVLISEWLLLSDYSSLHDFKKTDDDKNWIVPDGKNIDCDCCWRFRWGRRNGKNHPTITIDDTTTTKENYPTSSSEIMITPTTTLFAPFPDHVRRYDQMMYFNGPWVFEERIGKRGKKELYVRSYLLRTTSEQSVHLVKK
uniref:Uncharacterized protein n=1 Tax=Panagrolaimus sp. JU765 TaxID=591449 RepID=A0AC34RKS5_9BILA